MTARIATPLARPVQLGSCAISAVHCVSASTNTRSKNSSSGLTRPSSRSTVVRRGRWMRAAVLTTRTLSSASPVAGARPDLLAVEAMERPRALAPLSGAHALALELAHGRQAVGRELARLDRGGHAAAGLPGVGAVGEAAALGRRGHVGERVLHARRRGHPRQPYAGRVDDQRA